MPCCGGASICGTQAVSFLARPDEDVSAIYVWALACHGRAVVGLANVAEHLRKPRFVSADYFAQPSTTAGRDC